MISRVLRTASLVAFLFALAVLPARGQAGIVQQVGSVSTEAGPVVIEDVRGGLDHPWGLAFLPDGRLLVTERSGNLRIVNTETGQATLPVAGTPNVFAQGQGGLLDVALHPDFENNRYVYLSFSEPGDAGSASTALGRARLVPEGSADREKAQADSLAGFEVLFRQEPKIVGPNHFGGRIVFSPDGEHLFLTMGERFQFEPAQDLSNHLGTIARLNLDGSVPDDNPFVDRSDARPEIWSYGHRNIESAVVNPTNGDLWIAEMGPLGGDELNQPEAGKNYGWPVVSWGMNYDATDIPDPPTRPEFADAAKQWTPSISPSGMAFYDGEAFPEWRGTIFVGGLTENGLVRVETEGNAVTHEERIPMGARIRAVTQSPEGYLYVLTDANDGHVWRVRPLEQRSR